MLYSVVKCSKVCRLNGQSLLLYDNPLFLECIILISQILWHFRWLHKNIKFGFCLYVQMYMLEYFLILTAYRSIFIYWKTLREMFATDLTYTESVHSSNLVVRCSTPDVHFGYEKFKLYRKFSSFLPCVWIQSLIVIVLLQNVCGVIW
jgi:hypothetical protein